MNNSEIRNVTKEILKGKYKNVMLPFLLANLLLGLTQQQELYSSSYEAYGLSYVFTIGSLALFIQGPISIGLATYSPVCLLYTSPSPRDGLLSRMPSSA